MKRLMTAAPRARADLETGRTLVLIQFSSSLDGSAFSGLQLLDGFRSAGWRTHAVFAHQGPMIARYEAAGHAAHLGAHKNWLRQPRPWQFLRNWREATRDARAMLPQLRELDPTVVYVNSGASYAGARAASQLRVPTVWHLRELMASEGGELHAPWGFKRMILRTFRRLPTARVANSRHVADAVYGTCEPLHVVYNAVDDSYFETAAPRDQARAKLGLPADATVIGIPGTLRAVKGHDFALRALASWLRHGHARALAVSGSTDSQYAQVLQTDAARLGILQQVAFVGRQADMRDFYDACDVALVPSRSESFGRVAAEAMARGVPVVSSRAGGLPEVVQDQENGLSVDYGDEPALLRAVETLLADADLRERLRAHALEAARSRFTLDRYQRDLIRVVTGLVGAA